MYQTRGEYDSGVNTFSPEGRIFQVEYAMEAIKLGSTSIGICTKEGVVLAVDKRLTSPLVISSSVEKILEVDSHVGAAMSGIVADARTLIDKARIEAQQHVFTFNEQIKVRSIAQSICDTSLGFGKGGDMPSRPFGVALLVAGVDEDGPQLYKTDPSGSYKKWDAVAIGSAGPGAQTALDEEYNKNLTLQEGLLLGLKVLKQVMEDFQLRQVEVATVVPGEGFKILATERVEELISQLP